MDCAAGEAAVDHDSRGQTDEQRRAVCIGSASRSLSGTRYRRVGPTSPLPLANLYRNAPAGRNAGRRSAPCALRAEHGTLR